MLLALGQFGAASILCKAPAVSEDQQFHEYRVILTAADFRHRSDILLVHPKTSNGSGALGAQCAPARAPEETMPVKRNSEYLPATDMLRSMPRT